MGGGEADRNGVVVKVVVEEDLMARRWRLRGDARMRVCVCAMSYTMSYDLCHYG